MSESALVDTGFWIAFFDPQQPLHEKAADSESLLELLTLVVPWPTLYETLRTRFVKRPQWVLGLDRILKRPNVEFIEDEAYRDKAYSFAMDYSIRLGRPISLVDMLCRLVLDDIHVNYLLTTNAADFHDVCRSRRVEMLLQSDSSA